MRIHTGAFVLAVTAMVVVSGCSSNGSSGNSSSPPGSSSYVVSTEAPSATELVWSGAGATLGEDNHKFLAVPAAFRGTPLSVCWHISSGGASLETAPSTDITALANGQNVPADDSPVTGDGCAKSVTLDKYLEVVPTGDWKLTIDVPAAAPTTSASPSTSHAPITTPAAHPRTSRRPTPTPTPTHKRKRTSAPLPPSSAPESCHPLTNGGNCYEPGEFCRHTDEGVTGVAGDGETITCEDNNGLRWEPS